MRLRQGLTATLVGAAALAGLHAPAMAAKDTMTIAMQGKYDSLEPYQTSTRQMIQTAYMVYDALLLRDADTGELIPHLATSWTNPEPTVWEFTLQEGVKFHNGNPLTAAAVEYTIEKRILDPELNAPRLTNFKWIKDVEVIDDLNFRIHTVEPYPAALQQLNTLYVMDPISSEENTFEHIQETMMGSGPYKFVEWQKGSRLVLERNPDYWGEASDIENIVIKIVPEASTRLAELFSGGSDFVMNISLDQLPTFEDREDYSYIATPILRVDFWQLDSMGRAGETPLTDLRVRKAMAHAIDSRTILERLVREEGYENFASTSKYHWGHYDGIEWYEYDPEKAKALLAEAGYADGFEVDLWQYVEHQNRPNQAAMQMLAQVGIKVNLKDYRGNVGQMGRLRRNGQITGIGNFNWGSYNIFDADAILMPWFEKGAVNAYTDDEELTEWLNTARFSTDPEERMELYKKAQIKIFEQVYWIPTFGVNRFYGHHADLEIQAGVDEVPRFQYARWKK